MSNSISQANDEICELKRKVSGLEAERDTLRLELETALQNAAEQRDMKNTARKQRDALLAQVKILKGAEPALPQDQATEERQLSRYGIRWNGERNPICVPMDDGYWTPYHSVQQFLHQARVDAVKEFVAFLPLYAYNINSSIEKEADKFAILTQSQGAQ